MGTNADFTKAIIGAMQTVAPTTGAISASTHLMGKDAALDSIGFVTMLVQLEQDLGGRVDLSSSFLEHSGAEESKHPFLTVGSLSEHIGRLIS